MTPAARTSLTDAEGRFLEDLRSRYEAEGFTFTVAPRRSMLPPFLSSYTPDAIAQKPGLNIAIEVKGRSQADRPQLQDIRRLFEGRPDWRFNVFFIGSGSLQSTAIPMASPAEIRSRMEEVRTLAKQGLHRPAFVMAWSLLEAALQVAEEKMTSQPRTAGTVVQTLAMNGYISPDTERHMRGLITLRNQIVHGDVVAEATADDVNLVLAAIEETLSANVV